MKRVLILVLTVMVTAAFSMGNLKAEEKKKGIRAMSRNELFALALSAAPPAVANDATVMIPDDKRNLAVARKGTNGFICIPTADDLPDPDPMCYDEAVDKWIQSLISNAPKPSNTVPGIAYMARGGVHWEKDGKILMKEEPGAKIVKEPPHWMIMWPYDSKKTGLPTIPNPSGVYIRYDGTPYAHLMIYQDPSELK